MHDDGYSHMAVVPLEADDGDDAAAQPIPAQMSPTFSLAYLRECKDGAILVNREGRVSFLNGAAVETLQLQSAESAAGKSLWEIWPDELEGLLKDAHDRTLAGEAVRFTTFLGDIEGDADRWDVMTSPVIDSDGKIDAVFSIIMPAD